MLNEERRKDFKDKAKKDLVDKKFATDLSEEFLFVEVLLMFNNFLLQLLLFTMLS